MLAGPPAVPLCQLWARLAIVLAPLLFLFQSIFYFQQLFPIMGTKWETSRHVNRYVLKSVAMYCSCNRCLFKMSQYEMYIQWKNPTLNMYSSTCSSMTCPLFKTSTIQNPSSLSQYVPIARISKSGSLCCVSLLFQFMFHFPIMGTKWGTSRHVNHSILKSVAK